MPELQRTQKGGLQLLKKTMMYGEGNGRQHLRDYIINKRASEGLADIPDDLFANKPVHEMSDEERRSMMERRKRNKEAAERSRKKKKVEFEKLQSENDQLNQDKCELVAMVQKLKEDCDNLIKENDLMHSNFEHLKRWIGKRSFELGLTKWADAQEKGGLSDRQTPSAAYTPAKKLPVKPDGAEAEAGHQPSPPKVRRISKDSSQSTPCPKLQSPWSVEPVLGKDTRAASGANTNSVPQPTPEAVAQQLPENPPMIFAKSKPIIYVPKDSVVVFGGGGAEMAAIMPGGPDCRPMRRPSPQIEMEPPKARSMNTSRMNGDMASFNLSLPRTPPPTTTVAATTAAVAQDEEVRGGVIDTSGMDPAKVTAIESLLKLGCKIQLPEIIQSRNGDL